MITDRSWVEINLDNFRHNLDELKRFLAPGQGFLQIVKADAYGHGAFEIASVALSEGAVYLGVANPEEGKLLRLQEIIAPILILSPALIDEIPAILEHDLASTVSDLRFAKALSNQAKAAGKTAVIHVKVDTGMHRSGFRSEDLLTAYSELANYPNLNVEGVFSHFAASENDPEFTAEQDRVFSELVKQLKPRPQYIHQANSAAIFKHNNWQTNLVRLGISSYGIYTDPSQYQFVSLKSVMTFKSILAQVKLIKKGEYVGYNRTWKAPRDGRYGIIPIGYADGYDFLLSNRGIVSIHNQICPVIGKISMDMITLDLTSVDGVNAGDEVTLMGGGTNLLRAEQLTAKYKGSAYELLCQIGRRAKRYYFGQGKLISQSPLSRREFVSSDYPDKKLGSIISSAINQRLQDQELTDLIYRDVLKGFFYNKDNEIQYRKGFVHTIDFTLDEHYPDYYLTKTKLQFTKRLQNDYFLVACANSNTVLQRYFLRRDVEYRWLMDINFALKSDQFKVSKVMVNDLKLDTKSHVHKGCLEINCSLPVLKGLVGKEVDFTIETITYYPKASHQLSVFITELTKGVTVKFKFPKTLTNVETLTVFSGRTKFPAVKHNGNLITVATKNEEWVFPNSGIVFAY